MVKLRRVIVPMIVLMIGTSLFFVGIVTAHAKKSQAVLGSKILRELPDTVQGLREWYLKDRTYLRKQSDTQKQEEVIALQWALDYLRRHPDYRDSSGFVVYRPVTTGRIHLLATAIAARKATDGQYTYDELLGYQLRDESPEQYPRMDRVIRLLKAIPVSQRVLEGFKVYLLPYSMGGANGYGGNGYAFLAATPAGERLIANQLEVTLAHELGHHLHFRYMNRSTVLGQRLWERYLKMRGIPWHDGGEAGSMAWTRSSEEVFAEDYRVWVGGAAVGSGYFGDLSYPNPTVKQGNALKQFFDALPNYPAAVEEDLWQYTGAQGRLQMTLSSVTVACLGLPLIYHQVRLKRSGR